MDSDLVSAKWLHMPCSKRPRSLILQALKARSWQMVWNSLPGTLCLAAMFPKKHARADRSSEGHVVEGRGE